MLDTLIHEFILNDYTHEISNEEWLRYCDAYAKEKSESTKTHFLNVLAGHSGVPAKQIHTAFNVLASSFITADEQNNLLAELQKYQSLATKKIIQFLKHSVLKRMELEPILVTRTEWNALISKFEISKMQKLTTPFVLNALSSIKKINYEQLVAILNTPIPQRNVKRKRSETNEPVKRYHPYRYVDDGGVNPLVYLTDGNDDSELATNLKGKGVRVVSHLSCATPEKRYPGSDLQKTPGGRKVRPICKLATERNEHTFFKHLTPESKKHGQGRVQESNAPKQKVCKTLTNLLFEKAEPVEYTATRQVIIERRGQRRQQSARSIMGATAADVFRAYDINISSTEGRAIHWAHLIAHFLGDTQDITVTDFVKKEELAKEIINLVPSTAAANYNTLEAVELFIREQLLSEKTDKISIRVTPVYSGECLIPDLLKYDLKWAETNFRGVVLNCHEQFYINPKSYSRLTKSVHESIAVVRGERAQISASSSVDETEDAEIPTFSL